MIIIMFNDDHYHVIYRVRYLVLHQRFILIIKIQKNENNLHFLNLQRLFSFFLPQRKNG